MTPPASIVIVPAVPAKTASSSLPAAAGQTTLAELFHQLLPELVVHVPVPPCAPAVVPSLSQESIAALADGAVPSRAAATIREARERKRWEDRLIIGKEWGKVGANFNVIMLRRVSE